MKFRAPEWLRQIWPWAETREQLLRQYQVVGMQKFFLTDVALRGRVYSDLHVPGDHDATMVNIGRRELALEILELAGERPDRLFELVPRPKKETPNA
jgi:hypothetical protein